MLFDKQTFETTLGGRLLRVETGEYARQANGAVMVQYGDSVVLSTATASKEASPMNFFPLTVHYIEKMYAVGKLPGGFIKREGRPSENATLTSRLIDRPLRPMFPENVRNEIQIINTVLSVDQDNSPEIAAMIGSSIALGISDIPFNGPIAGVNVGRVGDEFVINPTVEQVAQSDIELTVAGTQDAINMVESAAAEVSETTMIAALKFGHETIKELVAFQEEIIAAVGKEKFTLELAAIDADIQVAVQEKYQIALSEAIQTEEKLAREAAMEAVHEAALADFEAQYADSAELATVLGHVKASLNAMNEQEVRRLITQEELRPDGRTPSEIRPLANRVGLLPRTHGSGLFTRGQTQTLTVATLAPLSEYQVIDGLGTEESKRFIHHYNFPSYSVGETGRVGAAGRREIGHGALGERAMEQVIPTEEDFPYVIRLVSEVLESNGSSSQASICSGTLAMMDAGIPIKAPVAGIAMGLVMEGDDYTILTDIQGLEDALGDMDFKVAGTEQGITALQMDIKISGITDDILEEAMEQAKRARLHILEEMTDVIAEPRAELSPYAPKIEMIQINPEKIKVVIGRGGETINQIIDETGVKIDIDDDGRVSIASTEQAMIDRAREIIELLTHEVEEGEEYEGTVKRVENFGAFVEILPGKEGLVHISEIEHFRIDKVTDILNVNDKVKVKVIEIDKMGRINLSRKALIPR